MGERRVRNAKATGSIPVPSNFCFAKIGSIGAFDIGTMENDRNAFNYSDFH